MKYIGQPYKSTELQNQTFDAIIIGSGIGGMTVASMLARQGKKILLLEQHYTIGGFTHAFKRKEYEWDVGLHYVGDVHIEGRPLNKIFKFLTDGKLKWESMGELYDKAIFGDESYEFVSGKENLKRRLKEYFNTSEDHKAIDRYFELIKESLKGSAKYYGEKTLPTLISKVAGRFLRKKFLKYSSKTTLEVLKSITNNQKLIGVLTTQYGDYGLTPAESSFVMHAMVANHYLKGAAYPVGGSGNIAKYIVEGIESNNGIALFRAEVDKIIVKKGKAVGVQMKDGKKIMSDLVISNAGVHNTYLHLLPEEVIDKHKFKNLLSPLKPSAAHVCLHIGIKKKAEELKLSKSNYWIFPTYDHDKNLENYKTPDDPFPVVYISFPSAKDPDWENRYPGKCTIEIITLAYYDWFTKWEDAYWNNRGQDYDQLKEKISQRLLEKLYEVEPQLKGHIDYYELSTPLSTRKFTNYRQGEIYGLAHNPERFNDKTIRVRTPVKNLFLTGQDIVTAGIGGGLFAGMLTASVILKKNMIRYVMKEGKGE